MIPTLILVFIVLAIALFATISIGINPKDQQYDATARKRTATLTWLNIGFAVVLAVLLAAAYISYKG